MNKAIRYCLLAAGVLALGYCVYVGVQLGKREVHHLTILHVNDTHSHMEPIRTGEYAGKGGILERTAYIDSVYAADGRSNVLLLHAWGITNSTTVSRRWARLCPAARCLWWCAITTFRPSRPGSTSSRT